MAVISIYAKEATGTDDRTDVALCSRTQNDRTKVIQRGFRKRVSWIRRFDPILRRMLRSSNSV